MRLLLAGIVLFTISVAACDPATLKNALANATSPWTFAEQRDALTGQTVVTSTRDFPNPENTLKGRVIVSCRVPSKKLDVSWESYTVDGHPAAFDDDPDQLLLRVGTAQPTNALDVLFPGGVEGVAVAHSAEMTNLMGLALFAEALGPAGLDHPETKSSVESIFTNVVDAPYTNVLQWHVDGSVAAAHRVSSWLSSPESRSEVIELVLARNDGSRTGIETKLRVFGALAGISGGSAVVRRFGPEMVLRYRAADASNVGGENTVTIVVSEVESVLSRCDKPVPVSGRDVQTAKSSDTSRDAKVLDSVAAVAGDTTRGQPKGFQIVTAETRPPDVLPDIDLSKKMTDEADFKGKNRAGQLDQDRLYSEMEVDVRARLVEGSANPVYPKSLLASGTKGEVLAQFVIDTTGRADTATFKVVKSTHPLFADAVRNELPKMRFLPAQVGGRKVKQLAVLPFGFSGRGS